MHSQVITIWTKSRQKFETKSRKQCAAHFTRNNGFDWGGLLELSELFFAKIVYTLKLQDKE